MSKKKSLGYVVALAGLTLAVTACDSGNRGESGTHPSNDTSVNDTRSGMTTGETSDTTNARGTTTGNDTSGATTGNTTGADTGTTGVSGTGTTGTTTSDSVPDAGYGTPGSATGEQGSGSMGQ